MKYSRWTKEARDLPPDPVTGTRITRLSGSSICTSNIYGDCPRTTPDGKRFASLRYIDHLVSDKKYLLCHDIETKWTCMIDGAVTGQPISPPWGGSVYYSCGSNLMRASLETCTPEAVLNLSKLPPCWQAMSISKDERYFLYTAVMEEGEAANIHREGAARDPQETVAETYNLVRVDLRDGSWKTLLEKNEPDRIGGQFNPAGGYDMIFSSVYWEGKNRHGIMKHADANGKQDPELVRNIHHSTWLAGKNELAALASFDNERVRHLPENPNGELFIYSFDGSPPRFIPIPDHLFFHISSSPCGRYVVCESFANGIGGAIPVVVVNVESGKYRVLVSDAKSNAGGDAVRQVNPYFTADLRHVVFNGDAEGVVNVYAAEIPAGFLEEIA